MFSLVFYYELLGHFTVPIVLYLVVSLFNFYPLLVTFISIKTHVFHLQITSSDFTPIVTSSVSV